MIISRTFSRRNRTIVFNKISEAFFVPEESFFYICHSIIISSWAGLVKEARRTRRS